MTPKEIFQFGYADLVSVIPPDATLSPLSKIKPESRGKSPGRKVAGGVWSGYDWQHAAPATIREVAQWTADGANIGLRARTYPAVDIDCKDAQLVEIVRREAIERLGMAPERQGAAPKTMLVYRTAEPFGRMRLWIGPHLVEVLGDGQQYVIAGMHPATRRPYAWKTPLVPHDHLAEITRDAAESFLTAVQEVAELLGYECRREGAGGLSVDREAINQAALAGDAAQIAAAMALIPNTNADFPGRDDYLRLGYALKASLGDAGFPLFEAWAMKWEGNDRFAGNDPEEIASDWGRMKPPFEVGAQYVYQTAARYGYNAAGNEFEATEEAPPLREKPKKGEAEAPASIGAGAVEYSDASLAARLLSAHAHEMRYCSGLGGWIVWDGKRWAKDDARHVKFWSGQVCKRASNEALATITDANAANKVATRVASNGSKNAIVDYAADHPAVRARPEHFDSNPMLLNTPSGIVDLESGELMRHAPEHLMTKMTAVGPERMPTPLWTAFLDQATGHDKALIGYLQRLAGYSLCGLTREHTLAFLYGKGGNGKGTFLNALTAIWADYAKTSPMETFTASSYDKHPTELATLAGARLVQSQETEEGRRWAEGKVKSLTGGDPITARYMREDFFTYQPQFKLLFAGNHRPAIANLDEAMRRRFHLVPFTIQPAVADKTLSERLKAEYPGILQWAIDGCLMWQEFGLRPPAAVIDATAEYFDDEDPLGGWMRERTAEKAEEFINSHALYEDWREWCNMIGEQPKSEKRFVQALAQRGIARKKQGGTGLRGFVGLALLKAPEFATV